MAAHLVQIVDNCHQIIALDAWHPLVILLSLKYVADLIVKVGGRPVKVEELLQRIVRGHDDCF